MKDIFDDKEIFYFFLEKFISLVNYDNEIDKEIKFDDLKE